MTNAWRSFVVLVRKDLIIYFTNRRALLMSIAAPILISAFFGSLFGDKQQGPTQVPIAIVDHDQSDISKKIVAAMSADKTFDVQPLDEAAAISAVDHGKLRAVVTIAAGFGERAPTALFGQRAKPEIDVRYDPSQSITLQLVEGLLAKYVMETVAGATFAFGNDATSVKALADAKKQMESSANLDPQRRKDIEALFASIERVRDSNAAATATGAAGSGSSGFSIPYELKRSEAGVQRENKYNSYSHAFVGMGVQFILFMGIDFGIKLLLARRLGLWNRLRAAPLSRTVLLGAQIGSGALIAGISFAIVMSAGILFFGVRIDGSTIGFVALIVAFAILTSAFGLLIAAIGKTPEATRGIAIFATLIMVMLGGAWVPAFIFPAWLQTASLIMPTRWAVDGFDAMTWRGLGLDAAVLPVLVMLGFALVFAFVAILRFDWDES